MCKKHIRARDINTRLVDLVFLLKLAQLSKEQVICLMHYLAQEADTLDIEAFFGSLAETAPRYREEMMTIAERLEQKGLQKGRQEGT